MSLVTVLIIVVVVLLVLGLSRPGTLLGARRWVGASYVRLSQRRLTERRDLWSGS